MAELELNLNRKLLAIQQATRALERDAKSGTGDSAYPYVSGAKILHHVRGYMDKMNLRLRMEVISIDNRRHDYQTQSYSRDGKQQFIKNKSEVFTSLTLRFTWVDCDSGETEENLFAANGQNGWDKGLGSALTYGERYFLLKYFHIPTDEDDVDALVREDAETDVLASNPAGFTPSLPLLDATSNAFQKLAQRAANGEPNVIPTARQFFVITADVEKKLYDRIAELKQQSQ